MATTIDGVTVTTGSWRSRTSALKLAVTATRGALDSTGRSHKDVDLLINAGLYRDRNLGEPALAPLIQQDVGLNPGDPHAGAVGTFSFDVANGGCGVLTALQIADGFLRSGTVATAVVVASDADPGHGLAPSFPFGPAGGALVCHWTDGDRGLGAFRWRSDPDDGATFRSTVAMEKGHNVLTLREDASFAARAGEVAVEAARLVLSDHGLHGVDVDLIVASPARPEFTKVLSAGVGVPEQRIATAGPSLHTVAFLASLKAAGESGRLARSKLVLFVSGAAGLTAGAALYRP